MSQANPELIPVESLFLVCHRHAGDHDHSHVSILPSQEAARIEIEQFRATHPIDLDSESPRDCEIWIETFGVPFAAVAEAQSNPPSP